MYKTIHSPKQQLTFLVFPKTNQNFRESDTVNTLHSDKYTIEEMQYDLQSTTFNCGMHGYYMGTIFSLAYLPSTWSVHSLVVAATEVVGSLVARQ